MCILLVVQKPTPEIDLLLLHNRDEFFDRPFSAAQWRTLQDRELVFGQDEKAGGTWLAMDKSGAFAAVLNIREEKREAHSGNAASLGPHELRTRGALPLIALGKPNGFSFEGYSLFNLVLGTRKGVSSVFSSSQKSQSWEEPETLESLKRGSFFSISNHPLPVPPSQPVLPESFRWRKCRRIEELTRARIDQNTPYSAVLKQGFEILEDKESAAYVTELPQNTGRSIETEFALSSIFVAIPEVRYQTVVSTVAGVRASGEIFFEERRHAFVKSASKIK